MVSADGAVVDDDIPRPERDCVPLIMKSYKSVYKGSSRQPVSAAATYLLHLKPLLALALGVGVAGLCLLGDGSGGCIGHIDVGHVDGVV